MGAVTGKPRFTPTDEQRKAMRLVEGFVNDGHLVLEPDRYVPDGGLRFQRPTQTPAPSRAESLVPSIGSLLLVLVFIVGVAVGAKITGGW